MQSRSVISRSKQFIFVDSTINNIAQESSCNWYNNATYVHTHTHLTALCPGLPVTRVSRYQKGKTSLDFTEANEWQRHQLGHMQVCTSLQTDNHADTSPLSFVRPDALPAAQPTASKHWRHCNVQNIATLCYTVGNTVYIHANISQSTSYTLQQLMTNTRLISK